MRRKRSTVNKASGEIDQKIFKGFSSQNSGSMTPKGFTKGHQPGKNMFFKTF